MKIDSISRTKSSAALLMCALSALVQIGVIRADDEIPYQERVLVEQGIGTKRKAVRHAAEFAEDRQVQAAAISLLVVKQDRKAVPILQRVLEASEDQWVQRWAAQGLTQLGNEVGMRAVREEIAAIGASDGELPHYAWSLATDLARAGDPTGYSLIMRLLDSREPMATRQAVKAVSSFVRFPELDAVDRLLALTRYPDSYVRKIVLLTVSHACKQGAPAAVLFDALQYMEDNDADPFLRKLARATAVSMRTVEKKQMKCLSDQ